MRYLIHSLERIKGINEGMNKIFQMQFRLMCNTVNFYNETSLVASLFIVFSFVIKWSHFFHVLLYCRRLNSYDWKQHYLYKCSIKKVLFLFWAGRILANGDVPNLRLSVLARERLESMSLIRTPVTDSALQDFHQHRLNLGTDPFDLKYHLYAIVVSIIHISYLVGLCFICCLTKPIQMSKVFRVKWGEKWLYMVSWKWFGRKWFWPIWWYHSGIGSIQVSPEYIRLLQLTLTCLEVVP
jgi:hypothetical protein